MSNLLSKRVARYSILETIVIFGISAAQVYIVRFLFDKGSAATRFRV